MDKEVSEDTKKKIYEFGALKRKALESGDVVEAEKYLFEMWNSIPNPKSEYKFYFQTVSIGMVKFYRDTGQYGKAGDWFNVIREAYGPEHNDYVEFLIGTVYYEAGQQKEAFKIFDEQFKKFNKRPFQGEKSVYLEFYLKKVSENKSK